MPFTPKSDAVTKPKSETTIDPITTPKHTLSSSRKEIFVAKVRENPIDIKAKINRTTRRFTVPP